MVKPADLPRPTWIPPATLRQDKRLPDRADGSYDKGLDSWQDVLASVATKAE